MKPKSLAMAALAAFVSFAAATAFAAPPTIPERAPDAKPWRGTKKPLYKNRDFQEALDASFTLEQPILLVIVKEDSDAGKELGGKVLRNPTWVRDYASKNLITLFIEVPICPEGEETKLAVPGQPPPKKEKAKPQPRGRRAKKKKMVPDFNGIKDPALREFVKSCIGDTTKATKWPYSWLYQPYNKGARRACMMWRTGSKIGEYYELLRVQMETMGQPAEFTPALKKIVDQALGAR